MNEEEHREKMIDRQWGLLAAIAQGYCQNPEFACTAYQPLADMIVRTANAVKERILHDPRIKATEAIEIGDSDILQPHSFTFTAYRASCSERCRTSSRIGDCSSRECSPSSIPC